MDETVKDPDAIPSESESDTDKKAKARTFGVLFKGTVHQGEEGGFKVENATVSIEEQKGSGVEEAEPASAEARVIDETEKFADGRISTDVLAAHIAEFLGMKDGGEEIEAAIQQKLEKHGIESLDVLREQLASGDFSKALEILPDGPVKDAVKRESEALAGEEEKTQEEQPSSKGEISEEEDKRESGEDMKEEESDEEELESTEVRKKAEWVFERGRTFGRGKISQGEFLEELTRAISGEQEVTDDQIGETRRGAEKTLEGLGIRNFRGLRDRMGYRWMEEGDFAPLAELVTKSPSEYRSVMKEVTSMVKKEKNKKLLRWVLSGSVLYALEDIGKLWETSKRLLYRAIQEELQRS